jgi:hypothetical protein
MKDFEIARASVIWSDHVRTGRNNQDAVCVYEDDDALLVTVCDGCSSGAGGESHNEVGAQLGARLLMRALRSYRGRYPVAFASAIINW